jgi:pimeloyl-ACP methyl ester carboxylesterase
MLCELPDATVSYVEYGRGRPILMLHGFSLDHASMVHTFEPRFAKRSGWRRIYLDMPGHGGTAARDWMKGSDDILNVVEEFIDAVIGSERFVVSGSSYGAHIARGLVHRRAASMDGLVVTVPVIVADPNERVLPPRTILARDEAVMAEARSEDMAWLSEIAVVQGRSVLANARALKGSEADEQFLENFERRFSFDVDKLPVPFPAPALFMMGRQDHVVGYRDAWAIIEDYPRATFAVFDRAGHLLGGEQPQLWPALVDEWLDRVEEWSAARA